MEFLHAMVRIRDIEESLRFYRDGLGLEELPREEHEKGGFTLLFLDKLADIEHSGGDGVGEMLTALPMLELTWNWDPEDYDGGRNFGHFAYRVADIYALCERLQDMGYVINRPPRDGRMAFVRSPDAISIELLQSGEPQAPAEPWASMGNTGSW